MRFIRTNLFVSLILFSAISSAQSLRVVNFAELQEHLKPDTGEIIVVNFWASWCKPCIEEMPYLVKAQQAWKNDKVRFVYVSLDFASQKEKAETAAKKHGLTGTLFLLKDDPNYYINLIDPEWQGDIPMTFIVREDGKYITHAEQFHSFEEIDHFIRKNK